MTGAELAAARRRAGLSQTALGAWVGIERHVVSYWECKPRVDPNQHAPRLMLAELHALSVLPDIDDHHARVRDRVLEHPMARVREYEARVLAEAQARWAARAAAQRARRRVRCGALTRKGTPCRALSEPGRRRCRFHGGRSTGPRTPEGKARIAEAQRRRWTRWRAERETGEAAPTPPVAP